MNKVHHLYELISSNACSCYFLTFVNKCENIAKKKRKFCSVFSSFSMCKVHLLYQRFQCCHSSDHHVHVHIFMLGIIVAIWFYQIYASVHVFFCFVF